MTFDKHFIMTCHYMVMSLNSASCGPYTYSDKAYIEMIYDQNLQDIGAENKFQNRGIAIALI